MGQPLIVLLYLRTAKMFCITPLRILNLVYLAVPCDEIKGTTDHVRPHRGPPW